MARKRCGRSLAGDQLSDHCRISGLPDPDPAWSRDSAVGGSDSSTDAGRELGDSLVVVCRVIIIADCVAGVRIFSGAAGTKWFGGSKWGAWGALIGGIVGMFFFPFGLILGPLIGALLFEKFFAKKENTPALVSGVGSVLGTVAGMIVKFAVGLVMAGWILVDALDWI